MATSIESSPPPGPDREGLDGLLQAFPQGRLSEIVGPRSSGGSSLLLALLAHEVGRGGVVALVDASDTLDPAVAARAGRREHPRRSRAAASPGLGRRAGGVGAPRAHALE